MSSSKHRIDCPTNRSSDPEFSSGNKVWNRPIDSVFGPMAPRECRLTPHTLALVDNPEHFVRRAVGALPLSDDYNRPTGRDENTLERSDLMSPFLEEASDRIDTDRDSSIEKRAVPEPIVEDLVTRSEVWKIRESTLT